MTVSLVVSSSPTAQSGDCDTIPDRKGRSADWQHHPLADPNLHPALAEQSAHGSTAAVGNERPTSRPEVKMR